MKNKFLKGNYFLFQKLIFIILLMKLLLENAIITKKPFLGATCVAGLEMGGKISLMTPSPGVLLARKNNMGRPTPRT
jgi:hypothetical protein